MKLKATENSEMTDDEKLVEMCIRAYALWISAYYLKDKNTVDDELKVMRVTRYFEKYLKGEK